jgi:hypothetical protein
MSKSNHLRDRHSSGVPARVTSRRAGRRLRICVIKATEGRTDGEGTSRGAVQEFFARASGRIRHGHLPLLVSTPEAQGTTSCAPSNRAGARTRY